MANRKKTVGNWIKNLVLGATLLAPAVTYAGGDEDFSTWSLKDFAVNMQDGEFAPTLEATNDEINQFGQWGVNSDFYSIRKIVIPVGEEYKISAKNTTNIFEIQSEEGLSARLENDEIVFSSEIPGKRSIHAIMDINENGEPDQAEKLIIETYVPNDSGFWHLSDKIRALSESDDGTDGYVNVPLMGLPFQEKHNVQESIGFEPYDQKLSTLEGTDPDKYRWTIVPQTSGWSSTLDFHKDSLIGLRATVDDSNTGQQKPANLSDFVMTKDNQIYFKPMELGEHNLFARVRARHNDNIFYDTETLTVLTVSNDQYGQLISEGNLDLNGDGKPDIFFKKGKGTSFTPYHEDNLIDQSDLGTSPVDSNLSSTSTQLDLGTSPVDSNSLEDTIYRIQGLTKDGNLYTPIEIQGKNPGEYRSIEIDPGMYVINANLDEKIRALDLTNLGTGVNASIDLLNTNYFEGLDFTVPGTYLLNVNTGNDEDSLEVNVRDLSVPNVNKGTNKPIEVIEKDENKKTTNQTVEFVENGIDKDFSTYTIDQLKTILTPDQLIGLCDGYCLNDSGEFVSKVSPVNATFNVSYKNKRFISGDHVADLSGMNLQFGAGLSKNLKTNGRLGAAATVNLGFLKLDNGDPNQIDTTERELEVTLKGIYETIFNTGNSRWDLGVKVGGLYNNSTLQYKGLTLKRTQGGFLIDADVNVLFENGRFEFGPSFATDLDLLWNTQQPIGGEKLTTSKPEVHVYGGVLSRIDKNFQFGAEAGYHRVSLPTQLSNTALQGLSINPSFEAHLGKNLYLNVDGSIPIWADNLEYSQLGASACLDWRDQRGLNNGSVCAYVEQDIVRSEQPGANALPDQDTRGGIIITTHIPKGTMSKGKK